MGKREKSQATSTYRIGGQEPQKRRLVFNYAHVFLQHWLEVKWYWFNGPSNKSNEARKVQA